MFWHKSAGRERVSCKWCFGLLGFRDSLDNGEVSLHCYAHWVIGQQASFFFLYSLFFSPLVAQPNGLQPPLFLCVHGFDLVFFLLLFPSLVVGIGVCLSATILTASLLLRSSLSRSLGKLSHPPLRLETWTHRIFFTSFLENAEGSGLSWSRWIGGFEIGLFECGAVDVGGGRRLVGKDV